MTLSHFVVFSFYCVYDIYFPCAYFFLSLITSQLKQFLDTEVLFHTDNNPLGFQRKADFCLIRDIFICSNRKTVATPWTCSLRCMQQQLTEVFQSCWKQLSIENLRTSLWERLCLSNMEMSKKNVNLIIVKWHFLQVIALLTVHCIIFSRHDWIASCSVIATGKLKWYVKSEKVLNASRW